MFFRRGQMLTFACCGQLLAGEFKEMRAKANRGIGVLIASGGGGDCGVARQNIFNAQGKFLRFKRLGHVIIGAGFKPMQPMPRLTHGGQHQARQGRRGRFQITHQIKPGFAGHHDIHHQTIKNHPSDMLARFFGIAGAGDTKALFGQKSTDQRPQTIIVIND